jgi:hypothetical protein
MPENVMMGKDSRLRLGHFHSAISYAEDIPKDRIALLDYTPPEMLAMAVDENDRALLFLRLPSNTQGSSPVGSNAPPGPSGLHTTPMRSPSSAPHLW